MQLTIETWSWIPFYFGRYEVSNKGRIRVWCSKIYINSGKMFFLSAPKIMRQVKSKHGYFSVVIGHGFIGDKKRVAIHRVVASVFCDKKDNKLEVNHINGVKSCNEWWNLEWVNRIESIDHAFRTGLIKSALGENQSNTKLSNEQVLTIFKDNRTYPELARMYGVKKGTIQDIKSGRTWWHLTGKKRKIKPSEFGRFKQTI